MSDENTAELRDTDAEFKRLKADFLQIARNRRQRDLSKVNPQEALRRLDVSHNGDQQICQNLKFLLNRRRVVA